MRFDGTVTPSCRLSPPLRRPVGGRGRLVNLASFERPLPADGGRGLAEPGRDARLGFARPRPSLQLDTLIQAQMRFGRRSRVRASCRGGP